MPDVPRLAVAALALSLVLVPVARGDGVPITTRLARALAVPGYSKTDSAAVAVELRSGTVLFARNPDLSLAPASNEKLPITLAALRMLGPSYRFRTEVLATGSQVGSVWHGDIYLKGFGDPTLTYAKLNHLAAQLAARGIVTIDGRVLGDESWFDKRRTAPGWKSNFYISECPPLSALVVNRAVYDKRVAIRPALAAAGSLRRFLRRHGITAGPVGLARAPGSSIVLAEVRSRMLSHIVKDMDLESDNFEAEMLLKTLGAEAGMGGTSVAGSAVVIRELAETEVPLMGVHIADGSGLSLDDRLTARALTAILVAIWNDPAIRSVVYQALPVAGISGTLDDRMQDPPARGAIRAKTGTTNEASALAGYARTRYAFAVVQNGRPILPWVARVAQDRFATVLASASE
jgi:serine-type D-Ala-D-Ala carboxypeptidase/endopeptidase (penicillin-binding protein 4)